MGVFNARFRSVARVACLDCPLCKLGEVGRERFHLPVGGQEAPQGVQVVSTGKIGLGEDQGRFDSLLNPPVERASMNVVA